MESFPHRITNNVTVEVHLNQYRAFETTLDETTFTGNSIGELEDKVRKYLSRTKKEYAIAVVLEGADGKTVRGLDHPTYVRAILRGKHERNHQYLFTIEGQKVALEYPHVAFLGSEVSDEDLAWLNERAQRVTTLRHEIANFTRARQTKRDYQAWILLDQAAKAEQPAEPAKEEAH